MNLVFDTLKTLTQLVDLGLDENLAEDLVVTFSSLDMQNLYDKDEVDDMLNDVIACVLARQDEGNEKFKAKLKEVSEKNKEYLDSSLQSSEQHLRELFEQSKDHSEWRSQETQERFDQLFEGLDKRFTISEQRFDDHFDITEKRLDGTDRRFELLCNRTVEIGQQIDEMSSLIEQQTQGMKTSRHWLSATVVSVAFGLISCLTSLCTILSTTH